MKQISRRAKNTAAIFLAVTMTFTATYFVSIGGSKVAADTNAQPLPFSQNWSNAGLITANDDWNGVPGIIGYRGDDPAITTAGIDPRTILADRPAPINVLANQVNPNTIATGAVAEFDTLANPTIVL